LSTLLIKYFTIKKAVKNGLKFGNMNLFLADSVRRTDCSAGPAVNAGARIDLIDVAFGYTVNRTFGFAGSAGNAFVRNYMRHFLLLVYLLRFNSTSSS